jgi:hypothetical protein
LVSDLNVLYQFGSGLEPWPVGVGRFQKNHPHAIECAGLIDGADVEPGHDDLDCPLVPGRECAGVDLSTGEEGSVGEGGGGVGGDVGAHEVDVGLEVVIECHFPGHDDFSLGDEGDEVVGVGELPQLVARLVHLRDEGGRRAHWRQAETVLYYGARQDAEHLI